MNTVCCIVVLLKTVEVIAVILFLGGNANLTLANHISLTALCNLETFCCSGTQ